MFREMRKSKKYANEEEIKYILENGEFGTLATIGENGYPYSLPISYIYINDAVYFHCATVGHKLDNINYNSKVSFSVVTDTKILQDKFTTNFKSVVIFGDAGKIEGAEKEEALFGLIKKYSEDFLEEGRAYIDRAKAATTIIKININHITGKVSER